MALVGVLDDKTKLAIRVLCYTAAGSAALVGLSAAYMLVFQLRIDVVLR